MPATLEITLLQHSNLKENIEIPDGVSILTEGHVAPEGHHTFRIIDPLKGDERLVWDCRNFADIKAAKKLFVDLIKKGLKPFRVGLDGKATAEVMEEFDPTAEEVIFLPMAAVAGG